MKIFCVDDDKDFLNELKNHIIEYSIKKNTDIKTITQETIPSTVPDDIDAYILDIMIGEENIFNFIKLIRSKNLYVPILISSSYDSLVFDSLKLNIFDFIRKKKMAKELFPALDNLVNYLSHLFPEIQIKHKGELKRIKLNDINYIETRSHETIIKINDECIELNRDVKKVFGNSLDVFLQISKSFYINPKYVKLLNKDHVVLCDETIIPIGRKYNKIVKDYFNKRQF